MIKLNPPFIDKKRTIKRLERVLDSGTLTQGEEVGQLEYAIKTAAQSDFAVAVSNATVGLELILGTLGLKPEDEVITTPFTFKATVNAILRSGAIPRYADVDMDYTISPASIEALINEKTKAVIVVHLYGYPAKMDQILQICRANGVPLIEDASQAIGSTYDGLPVGCMLGSYAGVYSFYATKNIAGGEGGAIVTNNITAYEAVRGHRNHELGGRGFFKQAYPTNARMSELNAAVINVQLEKLKEITDARRANALALASFTGDYTHMQDYRRKSNFHLYTVQKERPQKFIKWMKDVGIECRQYYSSIFDSYMIKCGRPGDYGNMRDQFQNAYRLADRVVSLPVHPGLSNEDIQYIGEKYREYLSL